ncbi:MAG: aminopeptidase [Clostridia bacterium]|nr:aminopeptidase [Clostridia bacterium]
MTDIQLENYADLVIKLGVNLQKGQHLEVICPTECEKFGLSLVRRGYENGAKRVHVSWINDEVDKLTYKYAKKEDLEIIPKWQVESKEFLLEEKACYIYVDSEDPEAYKGLDPEKIAAHSKAMGKALEHYRKETMANAIRWCIAAVPSENWAKLVFPNEKDPQAKLWDAIAKTMRLDTPDPVKAWTEHVEKMARRADYLNGKNFEYLHYETKAGTDFTVGLATDHIWCPAMENARDGIPFIANMPTEEIFTAPHNKKANGVIKNALPLSYNGNIIDGFSLTFKDGQVVDFSAEQGYETLKTLIETDEGSRRLGEVAIIGKNSPIAETGILFFNTLFDENASCHFALGEAYPTTVKGGAEMDRKTLDDHGANYSIEHVDFMVGTKDLKITPIGYDGEKEVIFDDGEWII